MKQKIYQVDAFTSELFSGNPAAVCPLSQWLSDELMQKIAEENNLAETAFYVKQEDHYQLRWFTPAVEVDLCGHATLAAAYVLFNHENHRGDIIRFHSPRSGELTVSKEGDLLTMDFPADELTQTGLSEELIAGFDIRPGLAFKGKTDYMLVFGNESDIRIMKPDLEHIRKLGGRGVIVTARGDKVDFVSRFFAPQSGINEDPVTGSAHTTLTPYWSGETGKTEMTAMQLSRRKGYLQCRYLGERVEISGKAQLYLTGEINLPDSRTE
jgi:PhzF family phenazine biosynthesis protein